MSSLERELFGKRMPPMVSKNLSQKTGQKSSRSRLDYSPLHWSQYFDSKRDLKINDDSFRVYLSGIEYKSDDNCSPVLPSLVLLHGGGYSSLTWALFSKSIQQLCDCRIIAIDFRGHGNTITTNDEDLSVQTLTNDVFNIITNLYNDNIPPLVLIGHSMGGAIAVHCAASLHELIPRIVGLVVIDVVEGTALDALNSMQSFLRGRPKQFPTIQNAIEWCVRSGQTRNSEAARISMPGQLKNIKTNLTATSELDFETQTDSENLLQKQNESQELSQTNKFGFQSLPEVESEDNNDSQDIGLSDSSEKFKSPVQKPMSGYIWRIDLSKSEPYWSKWFEDLSNMFLSCQIDAKLLLLAGIDRLDRALTVGQMQGKFQMQVLPKSGHTVQEDVPESVAQVIASFLIRNKFTQSKCDFERPFPSC